MADDDPAIDPRYAAQFQRGYDGPVLVPSTSKGVPRPTPERVADAPTPRGVRVPAPPTLVAHPGADEQRSDADDLDHLDEPAPWSRVYEWSLLGAGIGFLAIAAITFWLAATDVTMYYGQYPTQVGLLIDARNRLPGPLLVAGVIALSTWLAVRALRSKPKPKP